MTTVTSDDIAALTDALYAAVYDQHRWPDAAAILKQMIPAQIMAFGLFEAGTGQLLLGDDCSDGYDQTCFARGTDNPMVHAQLGQLVSDITLMPRPEFERSAFFNEWLRPQGHRGFVALNTLRHGQVTGFFGACCRRDERALEESDLALLDRLTPLLAQVAQLRRQLGALRLSERHQTYDRVGIGIALADAAGRLLSLNDTADRLLAGPLTGLRARRGVLDAGRDTVKLRRLLADAFAEADGRHGLGGCMTVPDIDGPGRGVALTVAPMSDAGLYGLPVRKAAIIFIQPLDAAAPEHLAQRLTALFGLTGKEAQVAGALLQGYNLRQAAELLQVSIHTVRTHLAQLFIKTDTRQQSQLVALLARLTEISSRP